MERDSNIRLKDLYTPMMKTELHLLFLSLRKDHFDVKLTKSQNSSFRMTGTSLLDISKSYIKA